MGYNSNIKERWNVQNDTAKSDGWLVVAPETELRVWRIAYFESTC